MVDKVGGGGSPVILPPVDDKKVAADLEKIKEDIDVGSGNLAHDVRQLLKDVGLLPGVHHHPHHHHAHGHHHNGPKLSMDGSPKTDGQGQADGIDEARLQKALTEIRDVASSCIDLLARVMLEQQGMQRHEAVQDRTNMRAMARGALLQAAGELNKQADEMQQAAITQLVIACVTAAVSIVAAAGGSAMKMKSNMNDASELFEAGEALIKAGAAAGKMGESMGSFAGTEGQIAVKQSEAAQKIDEANAQQYEGQADLKKDMQSAFDDNIKQIIQFLKELKEAVADLQSAITRHA